MARVNLYSRHEVLGQTNLTLNVAQEDGCFELTMAPQDELEQNEISHLCTLQACFRHIFVASIFTAPTSFG
jgi:hypothetical protein